MEVKIKLTHAGAKMPTRATAGAAGWDVYANEDRWISGGLWAKISLGFALEIPDGWCALLIGRSGLMAQYGVGGQLGLIDSDYRGVVSITVVNMGLERYYVRKGHRIGQLLFMPNPQVKLTQVQTLGVTARGTKGFGSTGK